MSRNNTENDKQCATKKNDLKQSLDTDIYGNLYQVVGKMIDVQRTKKI